MPSLPNDALDCLDRAEGARIAAEQLTDPDAKETMLELAQFYLQLAQAAAALNGFVERRWRPGD
jgi:hypothetical protein